MRRTYLFMFCLLAIILLALPASSPAQVSVGVSIHIGPPVLPVYAQPICPGAGYIWTPGYWAYGPEGYFWVPGTWVLAPRPGFLWTPGYWGFVGGAYVWRAGYWGPHVGFYGGVNYGFGYSGVGFVGGRWNGGVFAYNTAVTNVNTTVIHNTYVNKTVVVNNTTVNRVSYNGGEGGTTAQPTVAEKSAENEKHIEPTKEQAQHEHTASTNRSLLALENHGRPTVAATSKPGEFKGKGVESAKAENEKADVKPHANAAARNAASPKSNAGNNHANKQTSASNQGHGGSASKGKKSPPPSEKSKQEHSHGGK